MKQAALGVHPHREEDVRSRGGRFSRAVVGGPDRLSAEARREVNRLCGARPGRFWASMAVTWISVAGAISIAALSGRIWVGVLVVFFVSTRQVVLGLLMHEQVHRLGDRSKFGDWIVNLVAVYPLFVTTVEDYAKVHLSHHKYFMTEKDPDFVRKSGAEWTFPKSIGGLLAIIARDLSSINTLQLIRGKTAPPRLAEFERPNPAPKWLRWLFYAAVACVLTAVQGWTLFLLFWVLPLLTFTQLLVRWIAVVEHEYNVHDADVRDVTPMVLLKWWQKVLVPDMNFAMHVYHHMHPGVSFSQLPKVHEIYRAESLVDQKAIFFGQGAFLRYLARGSPSGLVTPLAPDVVEMQEDEGSTRSPPATASPVWISAPRFLVVEGDEVSALILENALKTCSLNAVRVRDAHAAAQAALSPDRPAGIFVSSRPGSVDGFGIARKIRAAEASMAVGRIPIIAITAMDNDEALRAAAHEAGVDHVLHTPFDAEGVGALLTRYTATSAAVPGPSLNILPMPDNETRLANA